MDPREITRRVGEAVNAVTGEPQPGGTDTDKSAVVAMLAVHADCSAEEAVTLVEDMAFAAYAAATISGEEVDYGFLAGVIAQAVLAGVFVGREAAERKIKG